MCKGKLDVCFQHVGRAARQAVQMLTRALLKPSSGLMTDRLMIGQKQATNQMDQSLHSNPHLSTSFVASFHPSSETFYTGTSFERKDNRYGEIMFVLSAQ